MGEWRIDELAREAGTTVRNVRAYQDRGLLPAPRREGRVAWYSDGHLIRLRLIGQLLERGYSMANIAELLSTWERGRDLGDLLGLEAVVTAPWSDETPVLYPAEELLARFGAVDNERLIEQALSLGFFEVQGNQFKVNSPRLLDAALELIDLGVGLESIVALAVNMQGHIDAVAGIFVNMVAAEFLDPLGDELSSADAADLARIIARLRPLAFNAVGAELARAMQRQISDQLGHRMGRLADHEVRDAS